MNEQAKEYIEKYPSKIVALFSELRQLIYDSAPFEPNETLWAKMPSYYIGEKFVRLIPFKDHLNIEVAAITEHKEKLTGYKITPKGMLQIFVNQEIPADILKGILAETLR